MSIDPTIRATQDPAPARGDVAHATLLVNPYRDTPHADEFENGYEFGQSLPADKVREYPLGPQPAAWQEGFQKACTDAGVIKQAGREDTDPAQDSISPVALGIGGLGLGALGLKGYQDFTALQRNLDSMAKVPALYNSDAPPSQHPMAAYSQAAQQAASSTLFGVPVGKMVPTIARTKDMSRRAGSAPLYGSWMHQHYDLYSDKNTPIDHLLHHHLVHREIDETNKDLMAPHMSPTVRAILDEPAHPNEVIQKLHDAGEHGAADVANTLWHGGTLNGKHIPAISHTFVTGHDPIVARYPRAFAPVARYGRLAAAGLGLSGLGLAGYEAATSTQKTGGVIGAGGGMVRVTKGQPVNNSTLRHVIAPESYNSGGGHLAPGAAAVEALSAHPDIGEGRAHQLVDLNNINGEYRRPLPIAPDGKVHLDTVVSSGYSGHIPADVNHTHREAVTGIPAQLANIDAKRHIKFIPDTQIPSDHLPDHLISMIKSRPDAFLNPKMLAGTIRQRMPGADVIRFGLGSSADKPWFASDYISPLLSDNAIASAYRLNTNNAPAEHTYAAIADHLAKNGNPDAAEYIYSGIRKANRLNRPYRPLAVVGASRGDSVLGRAVGLSQSLQRMGFADQYHVVPLAGANSAHLAPAYRAFNLPTIGGLPQEHFMNLRGGAHALLSTAGANELNELKSLGTAAHIAADPNRWRDVDLHVAKTTIPGLSRDHIAATEKLDNNLWNMGGIIDIARTQPHGMLVHQGMDDVVRHLVDPANADFYDKRKLQQRGLAFAQEAKRQKERLADNLVRTLGPTKRSAAEDMPGLPVLPPVRSMAPRIVGSLAGAALGGGIAALAAHAVSDPDAKPSLLAPAAGALLGGLAGYRMLAPRQHPKLAPPPAQSLLQYGGIDLDQLPPPVHAY